MIKPKHSPGYFMHVSTSSGQEGDSAWLETHKMSPIRKCHAQCLQFFYYHSGSESDQLNIWIREFQDERDSIGNLRLMDQITGEENGEKITVLYKNKISCLIMTQYWKSLPMVDYLWTNR